MNSRDGPGRPTEIALPDRGPVEYRYEPGSGAGTVVVCHGGHMRAGLPQGEDVFAAQGYAILTPSRPGYGRTPTGASGASIGADDSPAGFATAIAQLCDRLGIDRVDAVLGISAGGPTALALAAARPDLVRSVILQSAVTVLPWPSRATRAVGRIAFQPLFEPATWGLVRLMLRVAPAFGLRQVLRGLTTRPPREVEQRLTPDERDEIRELFAHMRSGIGFLRDLDFLAQPQFPELPAPVLAIAAEGDGSVPPAHAEALRDGAPADADVRVETVDADCHLLWYGRGASRVDELVREFLRTR